MPFDITITHTEAADLCAKAKAGDKNALERLVIGYMNLIREVALEKGSVSMPLEDRIQEGVIGFVRAVRDFDPAKGSLGTYAASWIRKYIRQAGFRDQFFIRIPEDSYYLGLRIKKVTRDLENVMERTPTDEEIGKEMGIAARAVAFCKKAWYERQPGKVLDTVCSDTRDPATIVGTEELTRLLQAEIAKLPPDEAMVIKLRFGLGGEDPHNLPETEAKTGFSYQKVRETQAKAMAKLRWGLKGAT
jgi:RNA polymerase primary sigma factor